MYRQKGTDPEIQNRGKKKPAKMKKPKKPEPDRPTGG
jgi:hypothetical protein